MNPLEINELQKAMICRGVDYETSELIIQDFRARCVQLLGGERYHEIMQAEREGRLVILPCKVGDSYYLVERFCTEGGYHDEKKPVSLGTCEWCSEECDRENRVVEFRFNSAIGILMKERFFGKTVSLTREEAEKALEGAK